MSALSVSSVIHTGIEALCQSKDSVGISGRSLTMLSVRAVVFVAAVLFATLLPTVASNRLGLKRGAFLGRSRENPDERSRKLLELRGGEINEVKGASDFDKLVKSSKGKLIVIDFTASWCGPCKMIAPAYEELSGEYTDSVFCKVDVDEVPDIAQRYEVMAMPTFLFLKNGEVVDRFSGASIEKLRDTIISNL